MAYFFTSESVSEGHPDKVCDQISDAILDEYLRHDPESRVAVETLVTSNHVVLAGETRSSAPIDKTELERIVRKVIHEIGYTHKDLDFCWDTVEIIDLIHGQSPDIYVGVDKDELGAGDQGMMFGFACREFEGIQDGIETLMPMPLIYAHRLVQELANIRKNEDIMPYLRPDSKSQVTIEYDSTGRIPKRVDTIIIATQHDKGVDRQQIKKDIETHLLGRIIDPSLIDDQTQLVVNRAGPFVLGGPHADAGLTGRKIIVDTYGGRGAHGGGAFSGKDPSKVDRSAAYTARYVAKNLVAAKLADMVEIQISYAIAEPEPVSIFVDSSGTVRKGLSDFDLTQIVKDTFDLRPTGIIERLDLKRPIYQQTAAYGHFGRSCFPWERADAVDELVRVAN
ncbi:MAG: methionine adenosyltransferase [Bacteroidetes bacterium]|nr:methionine adenosyltransferase [Bacteroidota bacterium]MCY4233700.1 methionine adenosyltransferase [Bacteroidota bacterium]